MVGELMKSIHVVLRTELAAPQLERVLAAGAVLPDPQLLVTTLLAEATGYEPKCSRTNTIVMYLLQRGPLATRTLVLSVIERLIREGHWDAWNNAKITRRWSPRLGDVVVVDRRSVEFLDHLPCPSTTRRPTCCCRARSRRPSGSRSSALSPVTLWRPWPIFDLDDPANDVLLSSAVETIIRQPQLRPLDEDIVALVANGDLSSRGHVRPWWRLGPFAAADWTTADAYRRAHEHIGRAVKAARARSRNTSTQCSATNCLPCSLQSCSTTVTIGMPCRRLSSCIWNASKNKK